MKKGVNGSLKFRVKDMDLSTGGTKVVILNEKEAKRLDLSSGDRLLVKHGKIKATCILDISENDRRIKNGQIGLFEEVLDKLNVKDQQKVDLEFTGKPESVIHIRAKLNGKKLSYNELCHIVDDITHDRLTDIEKTYFVAASYMQGLSASEIVNLTKAMVETGTKINFHGTVLDKHSIGGVPGNRTTMVIIPIIAAAGFKIPKTSSRAITSPAGTADTMECLARVELPQGRIKNIVHKVGACMVHGGSMNLAPADDKIIEVEHPLAIDAEGQLLASVMAKKYSVSANHVLIDVPTGKGTKADTPKRAKRLKKMFSLIGKKLGMNVKVILTDGSKPIGHGIGPLLEARDVMAVLSNDPVAPKDLREKSLMMAGILLGMTGRYRNGRKVAEEILQSGKALEKMNQIIKAQGKQKMPELGKYCFMVKSNRGGMVKEVNIKTIAKIARIAGAPDSKGSGIYLTRNCGQKVKKDELLYTIYAESEFKLGLAKELALKDNGFLI